MSLVFDLINVLTPDEVEKIRRMNVAGKEEEVLDILLRHKNKSEPDNELITSKLNISHAFCDKIKSVLLDKSYKQLTTGANTEIINFLSKKGSVPHLMKREILQEEKRLLKNEADDRSLFDFYMEAFRQYTNLPFKYFEEAFANTLFKKINKLKNCTPRHVIEMRGKITWMKISGAGLRAEIRMPGISYKLEQEINTFKKYALGTKLVFGRFMVNYLYGFLYGLTNRAEEALEQYRQMLELFNEKGHDLNDDNRYTAHSRVGEALYFCNRHLEAYHQYEVFFKEYGVKARASLYALVKFIQLAVITGHYDRAIYLLDTYMAPHLKTSTGTGNVMASLSYAKYYLCKGELEKGYEYVLLGQKFNPKNTYIQYEIELRNLENAYFFLKGDFEFARTLARKNLKFLHSKGMTMEKQDFGYYFHLVLAFYNLQVKGKSLSKEQEKILEHCNTATWAVYGKLLNRMKDMRT